MKEESLLLLSDLQKLINQVVLIDYTIIILGVEEMRALFLQLKEEGKTILLSSHNREDIEILCDDVFEMDNGILTSIKKS